MIECYDEYKTSVLGVQTVKDEDVCKYGIVNGERVSDRVYTVKGLVEKPAVDEAPSNVAILGRYIINPGIFDILAETKPGKGGEIQLTDALKELALKEDMYAYDFIGKRYDVGNKQGFLEATVETALRRSDLRDDFLKYLVGVVEKEVGSLAEVAAGRE
jgi:UTP--glucose-1-phosphate uridylyltransferase